MTLNVTLHLKLKLMPVSLAMMIPNVNLKPNRVEKLYSFRFPLLFLNLWGVRTWFTLFSLLFGATLSFGVDKFLKE